MPESQAEPITLFTTDARYRLREKVFLAAFLVALTLGACNWRTISLDLLAWRLARGINEWPALSELAERGGEAIPYIERHIGDPDPEVRYRMLLCLKAMRKKPLEFRRLEEFLKEYSPSV